MDKEDLKVYLERIKSFVNDDNLVNSEIKQLIKDIVECANVVRP